ncbi:MAG: hypothetical protein NVS4B8_12210 [Herpetosiphon sp.]
MTPLFTAEEQRTWAPFVLAMLHLLSTLDTELKQAFDLSHLDYGMLMLISMTPDGRRRMTELADSFGVDPSNITYRIRRLEKHGLVERLPCPTDGRVVFVGLTAAGRTLLRSAQMFHVAGARRHFLDHLTDSERSTIAAVFTRLLTIQQRANGPDSIRTDEPTAGEVYPADNVDNQSTE